MRITTVQKARKAQGTCGRCGDAIGVGDPYRWVKPRYGGKRIRCMKPECAFRNSDLTSNDKEAMVWSAVEGVQDTLKAWGDADPLDDLTGALEEAAEEVRAAGEEWNESADTIEEHFTGGSPQADEARERAEAAEEFAEALEEARGEVEGLEPEEGEEPTKRCPDCGDQRAEQMAQYAKDIAFPPPDAWEAIPVTDLKPGAKVVRDGDDLGNSFLGSYHPMHTIIEVRDVEGPVTSPFGENPGVQEYIQFSQGGASQFLQPVEKGVKVLKEGVAWRPVEGKKKLYEWYWEASGEAIPAEVPEVSTDCETCGGSGELALDDPDEWREEAKSMVEGAVEEVPF